MERDGIKFFSAQLKMYQSQQQFAIVSQIDESIKKWQKDTADLLFILNFSYQQRKKIFD